MTDSTRTITRSARRFFSGTMLSRISGLARDMSMAYAFGGHPVIAAFFVAFRFSHLCRRLFGEGAMQAAFVPHFEGCRQRDPLQAYAFFRDLTASLTLFLAVLIVAGGSTLWALGGIASPNIALILRLTSALLPGLLFICLYGLNSALLNCEKTYFTPSVAPVIFNLSWVVVALLLRDAPLEQGVWALCVAVVLACAAQWGMTVPGVVRVVKKSMPERWWRPKPFSSEVRKLIRPLCLGIAGVSATQINSALDSVFALQAHASGPAYLWYAIRLQQLPIALFGVGMAGALLPPLARSVEKGELGQFRHFLLFALKRSAALMIPCTLLLLLAGMPLIELLYGRGDFTPGAATQTLYCLWAYSLGLWPMAWVMLLAPGFYAMRDYRTPTHMAFWSVVLNVSLNGFLVMGLGWGPWSVAFATSIASAFNAGGLLWRMRGKLIKKETRAYACPL